MATKKENKEVELVTTPATEVEVEVGNIDLEAIEAQNETPFLTELAGKISETIKAIDSCIMADDIVGAMSMEKQLSSHEKEYAERKAACIYSDLRKSTNPILDAIKLFKFSVPSHRVVKTEDGIISEIEIGEKVRYIDLYKMCHHTRLPIEWAHYVSKLNQLLCFRAAKELKFSESERRELAKTYYLADVVKKVEIGETPDSNTQICKLLQCVIDKLLYQDDGNGKNIYKCNNHDVAYLLYLYAKKGKSALAVSVSKDKDLRVLVTNILRRIVFNEKYSLEGYKIDKKA